MMPGYSQLLDAHLIKASRTGLGLVVWSVALEVPLWW